MKRFAASAPFGAGPKTFPYHKVPRPWGAVSTVLGWALSVSFLLASFAPHAAHAQFEELLKRVPDSANILVVLNAQKIFDSSIARRTLSFYGLP